MISKIFSMTVKAVIQDKIIALIRSIGQVSNVPYLLHIRAGGMENVLSGQHIYVEKGMKLFHLRMSPSAMASCLKMSHALRKKSARVRHVID